MPRSYTRRIAADMLRNLARRFLPPDPHTPSLLRQLFSPAYRYLRRLEQDVRAACGGRVASGPFVSLRYGERSIGSGLAPKLLGTYELELTAIIDQIIATAYPLIVDIGAAEGYYAVGLATRIVAASVIAFEAQESQHAVLKQMAALNGVADRITLHGYCTPAALNEALRQSVKTLIICDVEGFESELLDPSAVPALLHADVLVELHEFARPGITELLKKRFMPTHKLTQIISRPRTLADWPTPVAFDEARKLDAMHEGRPGEMGWLWMESTAPSA